MARILGDVINSVTIYDPQSDEDVVFFYSPPNNELQAGYAAKTSGRIRIRRKGKVDVDSREMRAVRLEYGMKILRGFRDGDFQVLRDGKVVAISSQEGSESYYANWRDVVEEYAGDLVIAMAMKVFEGAVVQEEEEAEEEPEPKNSLSFSNGISPRPPLE